MSGYQNSGGLTGAEVDARLAKANTAVQPGDTIPIADGGTGATTAAAARTNLELVKQTGVEDETAGRVVLTDYNADSTFDRICKIAGMQPTLYLNAKEQDYRIYSPATGLTRKALTDIVTTTRASDGAIFDAKGQLTQLTSDAPRVTFDPETGVGEGLLVEESRTNLVLYSEDLSNAAWTKWNSPYTVTVSTLLSPISGIYYSKIEATAAFTDTNLTYQNITAAIGSSYAFQFFASKTHTNSRYIQIDGGATERAIIDLETASVSHSSPAFTSISCVDLGADVHIKGVFVANGTSARFGIMPKANSSIGYTSAYTAGDCCYVTGFDVQLGSFPTTYTPTTTAAATRAADGIKIDGTAFSDFYRQDEGTSLAFGADSQYEGALFSLHDETATESISLFFRPGDLLRLSVRSGGTEYLNETAAVGSAKACFAWDKTNACTSINGIFDDFQTNNNLPEVSALSIGGRLSFNLANSAIGLLAYFPRKLPDATLQQLSALVI